MTFETLENMWKISYLNAAFEFLKQVTTIFKHGAQRHALMRYALRWRAALDKVSPVSLGLKNLNLLEKIKRTHTYFPFSHVSLPNRLPHKFKMFKDLF